MGIPKKLLADDEEVLIHVRTHWKAVVPPIVVLVLVVVAASFLVVLIPESEYQEYLRWAIVGAAVLIFIGAVLWPVLTWLTSTYTVTNRRLVTRQGVITRTGRDIPLRRINDVSHERELIDRMLGCGTLIIWSAGEQGKVVLDDVPRVQSIRAQIAQLLYPSDDEGSDTRPA